MATLESKYSGSPVQPTSLLPIIPTPELQSLYDELRKAIDEQKLHRGITSQVGENSTDSKVSLQPGTLLQATTMSRSPSSASQTSTRHGITDEFGEGSRPDTRARRRAVRRRPLDKVGKAKAALVRKLHACPECKYRKVTCHHHDLSLLKEDYDARNTMQPGISLPGQPSGHQPAGPLPSSSHVQQEQNLIRLDTTLRDMDLRGVSANPANTPFHNLLSTNDAADQDILSHLQPGTLNTASLTRQLIPPSTLEPYAIPRPARHPSLMLSSGALPISFANGSTHESRYLPIGRQVSTAPDMWECQWAHNSDGTESLSSFNGEGHGCLRHCRGLSQLSNHYHATHGEFREEDPPFMWKCRFCRFFNDNNEQLCPQCPEPRSEWERWYYGYVTVTDRLASLPATSVQASDQPSAVAASLNSAFSSHMYSYSGFTSFATGCYSPGSGTGGSFLRRSLADLPEGIGRQAGSISYPDDFSSLTLALALASCLSAYGLIFASINVMAGWADGTETFVGTGSSWWHSWTSLQIVTTLTILVFLKTTITLASRHRRRMRNM